jgi:molybdate transport system ATP-binding protein
MSATTKMGDLDLDVTFTAHANEVLVLVGPSGSGKSTCLNIAAGLLTPKSGVVRLGERTLLDTAAKINIAAPQRRIGLVFQDYALFPHMTARENVAYGIAGERKYAIKAAGNFLARFGLATLADRPVTRLSGGEKQRVALARAVAAQPDALLLDEPLAALDVTTRDAIRVDLKSRIGQLGIPCVFVTHDPIDALVFGDRIVAIENGRVTQTGTRDELAQTPRTQFVADITGLNLIKARLDVGKGLRDAVAGDAVFHVLADGLDGDVYLSFAPSEVGLSVSEPAGSARNVFASRVRSAIPLGETVRIQLDGPAPLTAVVTRESAETLGVVPGAWVWASVKATAIRVYR